MQWSWALGLLLVAVAVAWAAYRLYAVWRDRSSARGAPLDLVLDDLDPRLPEPKWRRPEFVDDTAPAVLSVPPELDHPEWDNPSRDRPPKRAGSQRWLH